jgi:hypothetical protein
LSKKIAYILKAAEIDIKKMGFASLKELFKKSKETREEKKYLVIDRTNWRRIKATQHFLRGTTSPSLAESATNFPKNYRRTKAN